MSVAHLPFHSSGRAWCGRRLTKQQRLPDETCPATCKSCIRASETWGGRRGSALHKRRGGYAGTWYNTHGAASDSPL